MTAVRTGLLLVCRQYAQSLVFRSVQCPLAYREKLLYTPLGNRYEQTKRFRPRHTRSAPLETPRVGALARVGHQSAPEIHLRRRAAGQRRLPLPCIAQVGAGRLDRGRVEADGE